jgi:hypothetical protein
MSPVTSRRLLVAALGLGVLGNWVFRVDFLRLGFMSWVLGLAVVAWLATPAATAGDPNRPREHRLLMVSAAVLASMFVFREAEMLYALDFFALVVLAAVIGWRAFGRPLAELVPRDAIAGGLSALTTALGGAPLLALRDAAPPRLGAEERKTISGFTVGMFIAAPVLLVVAALLGKADPVFGGFLANLADLLDIELIGHLVGIAAATWIAAGALRGSLVPIAGGFAIPDGMVPRVGFPVVAPLLGGLALLLSAWIGVQVRVLFGGSAYIVETSGVTVAEYARAGFFELVVIAGIVLAVLLATDEFLDRTEERARRSFRVVGRLLLVLVGVLLISALQRLGLYLGYFGLTEDRVLALAVLVWVALVLAWFGWTVLRDARSRFAPGVLVLSAVWLMALNASNPEKLIVRTNLARAEAGKEFDVAYHLTLSADAVPALLAGAPRLGLARQKELEAGLARVWAGHAIARGDWRTWSLPYDRAMRRLQAPGVPAPAAVTSSDPASGARRASAAP